MGYLLDTHTFIWMMDGDERLPKTVGDILTDESQELWISTASFWEMSIKRSLRKLDLNFDTQIYWREAVAQRILILKIELPHLLFLEKLPPHHRDPFDRLLIAQAQAEGHTLLSRDGQFESYNVACKWG